MNQTSNKDSLTQYEILQDNLDIPARYVISTLFICSFLVFFGYLDVQITDLVGIVFPIYWTVKALERPNTTENQQWLSYWGIFFTLLSFDFLFGSALARVPYYYFIKICFLMWLFLPNTQGALFLHENLFQKIYGILNMGRTQGFFNRLFYRAKDFMMDILESIKDVVEKVIQIPEAVVETTENIVDQTADAIGSKLEQYTDQPIRDSHIESQQQMPGDMTTNGQDIKKKDIYTPLEKRLIEQ
jgi:receptor expression-enhancing protein 5/6